MQFLFTKYWNVVAVLILFATLLFFPSSEWTIGELILFSVSIVFFTLSLPPVRRNETLGMARYRVMNSIVWDAFPYIGLIFSGFLFWQWQNGGRELTYAADLKVWSYSPSALGWGPTCVNSASARGMFFAAIAMTVSVFAVRHGLSNAARRYLLAGMCWTAFPCALVLSLGDVDLLEIPRPAFMGFLAPSHAACFFSFIALLSAVLSSEFVRQRTAGRALLTAVVFPFALIQAFSSSSLSVIAPLLAGLLLITGLTAFLDRHVEVSPALKGKVGVLLFGGVLFAGGVSASMVRWTEAFRSAFYSSDWTLQVDAFWQQWLLRANHAMTVWVDNPWLGVGSDGYSLFMGFYLKPDQWRGLTAPKDEVMNGFIRGLVEYGVVGVILVSALVVILLVTIMLRLYSFKRNNEAADAHSKVLPSLPVGLWIVCAVSVVQTLFLEPFNTPIMMLPWCITLACSAFFVPAGRKADAKKQKDNHL